MSASELAPGLFVHGAGNKSVSHGEASAAAGAGHFLDGLARRSPDWAVQLSVVAVGVRREICLRGVAWDQAYASQSMRDGFPSPDGEQMPKITIRYFRLRKPEAVGWPSLEAMVKRALGQIEAGRSVLDRWKSREWIDDGYDPPKVLLANHVRPSQRNLFGDLLAMRPGQVDRVIDTGDENVREASSKRLPLSNDTLLIRNSLFWLLEGDHVVICSSGLVPSALEHYLTWFLHRFDAFDPEATVKFDAAVTLTDADLRSIKEITLGDKLVVTPGERTLRRRAREEVETAGGEESDVGAMRRILIAVFGSAAKADSVLDKVPPDQSVGWSFSIRFVRADPAASREALEEAYRYVAERPEAGKVAVKTASGRTKQGEDFMLSEVAEVRTQDDGLLDRDDILRAMQVTLARWKEQGRVPD